MIKRVIHVKSVGRFRDATPGVEGDCGKVTLVSAENGSGKTTIAAILHSLASGEPGFITERDTVSTSDKPDVKILLDDVCHHFKDGDWQTDVSDVQIEVFDTHFVNTNVYAGDYFEHGHKKALYQFIIGEAAGKLDREIREIDRKSREVSGEIKRVEQEIREQKVGEISLEAFIELPEVDKVEEKIAQKEERVAQLQRVETLRNRSSFKELKTFSIPVPDIEDLLAQTLEDVSDEAEERLKNHIEWHTNNATEEWLGEGLNFAKEETCPFCGADTAQNNTVRAFREYFSEAYKDHKRRIGQGKARIDTYLPRGGWNEIKLSFEANVSLFETWSEDIDFDDFESYSFADEIEQVWKLTRSEIESALDQKESAPLETYELLDECKEAIGRFQGLFETVSGYNEQVKAWNERIDAFKQDLEGGDLQSQKQELDRLKNCKSRHNSDTVELCEERARLNREKGSLGEEKKEKRDALDEAEASLMENYHDEINAFLNNASADFRVVELSKSMLGGSPNASYAIEINGETIQLGTARTDIGQKGFRNILSEGDRSTLAFAFFYAKVSTDPNISEKTVVIDDPVSSLDSSRQHATKVAIQNIASTARQVIVLSHDPRFLVELGNDLGVASDDVDSSILAVRKQYSPSQSQIKSITPGDLKAEIEDRYIRALNKVKAFYYDNDTSDMDGVERSLRIVLEDTLSRRYPERNLGMASTSAWEGAIVDAAPATPLHELKDGPYHEALTELNSFIHDSHHAGNITGPPNRDTAQLRAVTEKTLKFVYGTLPT